jgi:16S rRNA (guanine(966)-N(2))-methyltransferase RsmD
LLRILGGAVKGRKLSGPEGLEFRPATGQVKEFLFFLYRDLVPGARVLDLFSGSGSLGLEALSRGASESVFVESAASSLGILRKNIAACGFAGRSRVLEQDVFRALDSLGRAGETFGLILADPPFKENLHGAIAASVARNRILSAGGVLAVEHDGHDRCAAPAGLAARREKKFGNSVLTLYGPEEAP